MRARNRWVDIGLGFGLGWVALLGAAYPAVAWAAPLLAMFAMVVLRRQTLLGFGGAMLAASLAAYAASRGRYDDTLVHSIWRCGNGNLELWRIAIVVLIAMMQVFTAALAFSVPSTARRVLLLTGVGFAAASTLYFAVRGKLDRLDLSTYEAGLTTVEVSSLVAVAEKNRLRADYAFTSLVLTQNQGGVVPSPHHHAYPPDQECSLHLDVGSRQLTQRLAVSAELGDFAMQPEGTPGRCPALRVRADVERDIVIVEGTNPQEGYLKFAIVQGERRDLKRSDLRDLTGVPAPWWLSVALLAGLGLLGCTWALSTHRGRARLLKVPHVGGGWFELPGGARVPGPEPALGLAYGWVAAHEEHAATYRSGELPAGITVLPAHASDRTQDRIDGFLAWALACFTFAAALLAGHA